MINRGRPRTDPRYSPPRGYHDYLIGKIPDSLRFNMRHSHDPRHKAGLLKSGFFVPNYPNHVIVTLFIRDIDIQELKAGLQIRKEWNCPDCKMVDYWMFRLRREDEQSQWTLRIPKANQQQP